MKNHKKFIPIRTDDGVLLNFVVPETGEVLSISEALDCSEAQIPLEDRKEIKMGQMPIKTINTAFNDFTESTFSLLQTLKQTPLVWIEKSNPDLEVGETDTGHWEEPVVLRGGTDLKSFHPEEQRRFMPGAGCENKIHPVFEEVTFQPAEISADEKLLIQELLWSQIIIVKQCVSLLENSVKLPQEFINEVISMNLSLDKIKLNLSYSDMMKKFHQVLGSLTQKDQTIKNLKMKLYKFHR